MTDKRFNRKKKIKALDQRSVLSANETKRDRIPDAGSSRRS